MRDGASALSLGHADGSALHVIKTPKLVGRPVFGPNGHVAYSAGDRVYVDGVAVSPAGSHASSPTFCDGPRGLLVVFAAGPSTSTDLFVTDTVGGAYRRLTAGAGANGAPACSADGRLVAFFSTRTIGLGAGLYVTPLDHASRVHRLGPELGDSLEWEPLPEARR
jgi:TolB protein